MNTPQTNDFSQSASEQLDEIVPSRVQEQDKIEERRRKLDAVVSQVLAASGSNDVHHILPRIRRWLMQFHLVTYFEEREIFLDAYTRAVLKINRGEEIVNIPGWFVLTAYNIVRELSRTARRQVLIEKRLRSSVDIKTETPQISEHAIEANVKVLTNTINKLKEKDYIILNLRIVEGLSWKEIANRLVESGEEVNDLRTEQRIRQRGHRLLKELRKIYSAI